MAKIDNVQRQILSEVSFADDSKGNVQQFPFKFVVVVVKKKCAEEEGSKLKIQSSKFQSMALKGSGERFPFERPIINFSK